MNVQCTSCKTVFRVDPRKVPAGGVRARCSICRAVFEIAAPADAAPAATAPAAAAAPAAAPAPALTPTSTPAPSLTPAAAPSPTPTAAPAPQVTPAAAPAPTPEARPTPPPTPAPASAPAVAAPPAASGARTPSPFGASDPASKARRLARALISDIVTYFPERRDKALADGTLRREFTDEIKKSWEEYVGQVGEQMAKGTPHFREALNDILAKGQQVF
ncbi:MAG TPA: zinc-ribbon domain-containing protein [Longimicrobium sp.]|nr:zinc-ribbon domain-containing protein [Longimicrobium sp.]